MDMRNGQPAMSRDVTSRDTTLISSDFFFLHVKLLLMYRGIANSKFTLSFAYMQCFPDVVKHIDWDECKEHPEVCLYFHAQLRRDDLSHSVRIHQPVSNLEF